MQSAVEVGSPCGREWWSASQLACRTGTSHNSVYNRAPQVLRARILCSRPHSRIRPSIDRLIDTPSALPITVRNSSQWCCLYRAPVFSHLYRRLEILKDVIVDSRRDSSVPCLPRHMCGNPDNPVFVFKEITWCDNDTYWSGSGIVLWKCAASVSEQTAGAAPAGAPSQCWIAPIWNASCITTTTMLIYTTFITCKMRRIQVR